MCICWCVTEINYKMHGATIKKIMKCSMPFCQTPLIWSCTKFVDMSKDEQHLMINRSTNFGVKHLYYKPRHKFSSVINQLMHKFLFYNKFIICLYMFRALCAHHQEVKIVLYSMWYRHTYRCDDTRCCVMQFLPPDDELETCRDMK